MPKIIWMLWLQGWDDAPELVRACLATWRRHNPGWEVRALSRDTLYSALERDALAVVDGKDLEPEALSDVIRLAVLLKHGGVWADATVYCMRPLEEWLPDVMGGGFFAFDKPKPHKMLSSWFLAAARGSHIIERWHQRMLAYWRDRDHRDDYAWVHYLFADCYREDETFRAAWDATPKVSAAGPHYAQRQKVLLRASSDEERRFVESTPLQKLNHKLPTPYPADSLMRALCDRALSP